MVDAAGQAGPIGGPSPPGRGGRGAVSRWGKALRRRRASAPSASSPLPNSTTVVGSGTTALATHCALMSTRVMPFSSPNDELRPARTSPTPNVCPNELMPAICPLTNDGPPESPPAVSTSSSPKPSPHMSGAPTAPSQTSCPPPNVALVRRQSALFAASPLSKSARYTFAAVRPSAVRNAGFQRASPYVVLKLLSPWRRRCPEPVLPPMFTVPVAPSPRPPQPTTLYVAPSALGAYSS